MSHHIISLLRAGDRLAYETLYSEHYRTVEKYIVKNSGSIDDAKDIFQDTLLILLQKLKADDFELTASLKTYIIAIAKNLWFKRLRHFSYFSKIEFDDSHGTKFYEEISSSIENEKTYLEKLHAYMEKITAHCNYLLRSIFFQNSSIETVQKEFGYTSIHNAQNQKHKCISQLRKVQADHALTDS